MAKTWCKLSSYSLNSHLHHESFGCLSGGQTRQFTSTFGFNVFAKLFKYPNRTFLHGNSQRPLLNRVSCVLQRSIRKTARLPLTSTVLKGWSKAQLDLRKKSIMIPTSGFSSTLNILCKLLASIPAISSQTPASTSVAASVPNFCSMPKKYKPSTLHRFRICKKK